MFEKVVNKRIKSSFYQKLSTKSNDKSVKKLVNDSC